MVSYRIKSEDQIDKFITDTKTTLDTILEKEKENIDAAVEILFEAWKNKKRVFVFGNGGSASNASHFFCDLTKATIVKGKPRIAGMCLNDNPALFSAHVNDDGWENVYTEQLMNHMSEGDVVIAISVHGGSGRDKAGAWSQNLLRAIDYANMHGGKTIGLSGFDGGALKQLANVCITIPVNSTPHVEPLHTLMQHMVCDILRNKIVNESEILRRAVFFDRDGVINKINYSEDVGLCTPHTPSEFEFLPNAQQSVKRINDTGMLSVLVGNQPDVSKGRLTLRSHDGINEKMVSGLMEHGAKFDRIYYCLHKSEDNCGCRKPKPGMLLRAAKELVIDLEKSYMIGDNITDIEAGNSVGCRTILIANPRLDLLSILKEKGCEPEFIVKDIQDAVNLVVSEESKNKKLVEGV